MKHAVLIVGAVIVLLPFYTMVSCSLKLPGEIQRNDGGFMGAQEPMIDARCVKLGEPNRTDIDAARG